MGGVTFAGVLVSVAASTRRGVLGVVVSAGTGSSGFLVAAGVDAEVDGTPGGSAGGGRSSAVCVSLASGVVSFAAVLAGAVSVFSGCVSCGFVSVEATSVAGASGVMSISFGSRDALLVRSFST